MERLATPESMVTVNNPPIHWPSARSPVVHWLIQARMSSTRFPGKSLAPFHGTPLIWHVIQACLAAAPTSPQVMVVTTDQPADHPLVLYLRALGISLYRGSPQNVFRRYTGALKVYPCDWFFRVCGDSLLLDPRVFQHAHALIRDGVDVISNVYPVRQNPPGQSVELIRTATFQSIDDTTLTDTDREHVTTVFYRQPEKFRIVTSPWTRTWEQQSYTVDTIDDLRRLENTPSLNKEE